jgi:hypothetical protein
MVLEAYPAIVRLVGTRKQSRTESTLSVNIGSYFSRIPKTPGGAHFPGTRQIGRVAHAKGISQQLSEDVIPVS